MMIQTTCTGASGNTDSPIESFESETDEESTSLGDVFRENVEHELLDVVEDSTTFIDSG